MPMFPRFSKSLGLKATLVGAMLLTVGTTAAIVYLPWSLVSKRNIDTIVGQVNQEIALGTSQEVEKLLSAAESAQSVLVDSLEQNLVDAASLEEKERFFLTVLRANPNFTWVLYGEANGDFLGAKRTEDGQLESHLRDWDKETKSTMTTINTYPTEGPMLTPVDTKTFQLEPSFFTPDRAWYKKAAESPPARAWTLYVYRTTQEPGLGATTALMTPQGEVWGAIGVSIGLNQLSEYLQQIKGDNRIGEAFIINDEQELIASTYLGEAMPIQGENYIDLRLPKLSEANNPLLRAASQTWQTESLDLGELGKVQQFSFQDSGTKDRYLVSFTPLEQLGWVVGTVIPEASYLARINRNKRILLSVIALFTGLTAGAAVLLADRLIVRPVLDIAHTAANIEDGRFDLAHLGAIAHRTDEIGQLARVFSRMAQEVYSREENLKQQVRGLRIEIDEVKRQKQVKEIVETDFFQDLTAKAKTLRDRHPRA